jgi:hypothetical protein
MRSRFVVLAAVIASVAAFAAPAAAVASPIHNYGLTINVTPQNINAGQEVFIYGQLKGSSPAAYAYKPIYLYHRIAPRPFFSLIQVGHTNALGFYEFFRPDGIVMTNRQWFVRGPNMTHSRTVSVSVAALVTLSANTSTATTGQRVLFSGSVSPYHPFQRVKLQEQNSLSGNGWSTIAIGFTGGGSNFVLPHTWAVAGDYTLRAVFQGDPRNTVGVSDTVTVAVQQRQQADFTINSSAQVITDGQSATISGTLYQKNSATPEPNTLVTLWSKVAGGSWQATTPPVSTSLTGAYQFTVSPTNNTVYQARTTLTPIRHSALLYEGVQDVVTMAPGSTTGTVGGTDTFAGMVSPDHTGHAIYLQLSTGGSWHNVEMTTVGSGSAYSFTYTFGQSGTFQFRTRITGGPENVGAASSPQSVTVSGVAPVTSLPPTTS